MIIWLKHKNILFSVILCLIICLSIFTKNTVLPVSAKPTASLSLPILMYHHISPNKSNLGKYVITPEEFESDIIFLKSRGYQTVTVGEILNCIEKGLPFPNKAVMITFDDGYLSFYEYAYPILQKHSCKAVLSIIGYYTELYTKTGERNPSYAHVTFEDISKMHLGGLVEIANHSYDMHNLSRRKGISKKENENYETHRDIISKDILKTQEILNHNTSFVPYIFTYPFGFHDKESEEIIASLGFRASFICEEKVNRIDYSTSLLFNLGRFNRASGIDFEKLWNNIEAKMIQ